MKRLRDARGFSLMELIIAVGLFTIVSAAMASIYSFAYRSNYKRIVESIFANNKTALRRSLASALDGATYLEQPPPGMQGETLTAWANVDADGSSRLREGEPARFTELCYDPESRSVYMYQGASTPPRPGECGRTDERWTRTLVSGGGRLVIGDWRFSRSPAEANRVRLDFTLAMSVPALGFDGRTSVAVDGMIDNAKD